MRLLRLIRFEAFRRPLSLLVVTGLCAVGLGGGLLALGLVDHLATAGMASLHGAGSERLLRVSAPQPQEGLFGERQLLTPADIAFLEQQPGVETCTVVTGVPIPASMHLRILGLVDTHKDLTLYALDRADVPTPLRAQWDATDGVVPLLLNEDIVTLYNFGLADRYGKPRLNKDALVGLAVSLAIGKDSVTTMPGHLYGETARIVGFSDHVPWWGAAVPRAVADAWLRRLFGDDTPPGVGPLLANVQLRTLDDLVAARAAIQARGLPLRGETRLAEAVLRLRAVGRWVVWGLIALVAVVLAVGSGSVTVAVVGERRRSLALYRSCGARLGHLWVIFGTGLVLAALTGAAIGAVIAHRVLPLAVRPLTAILAAPAHDLPSPALSWSTTGWAVALAAVGTAAAVAAVLVVTVRRPLLADLAGS